MPATLLDRRTAGSKLRRLQIEDERLICDVDSVVKQAMRLEEIKAIRLSIEMAGKDQQIVCRVTGAGGTHIIFGSQTRESATRWRNNAVEFRHFLKALHTALRPRWGDITFTEGPSLAFRWTMFAGGSALAVGGAAFALALLWRDQAAGFFLLPLVVLGGWLAMIFRPRARQAYDPADYADQ